MTAGTQAVALSDRYQPAKVIFIDMQKFLPLFICIFLAIITLYSLARATSTRTTKNTTSILFYISCILFGLFVFRQFSYSINYLYVEIREMANITAIINCRNGLFSYEGFPGNIYLYGFLQPKLLSFLPDSCNLIIANRCFNWFCLLASCFVIVAITFHLPRHTGGNLTKKDLFILSVIYLFPHLLECPLVLGTPNFLGLLISNLIFLCALSPKVRYSVFIPILLAAAYLTKQYYLYAAIYPLAAIVLHSKDKKSFARRILFAGEILMASAFLIYLSFHSEQTYYSFLHHLVARSSTFGYFSTAKRHIIFFVCYVPLPTLLIAYYVYRKLKSRNLGKPFSIQNLTISQRYGIFLGIVLFFVFSCLLRLGAHGGALGLLYFSQLAGPVVTVIAGIFLAKYQKQFALKLILISVLVVQLSFATFHTISANAFNEDSIRYLQQHIKGRNVLGCALTSYIEFMESGRPTDNGQLVYAHTITPKNDNNGHTLKKQQAQYEAYLKKVTSEISQKKYDYIYTDQDYYSLFSGKKFTDIIQKSYQPNKTIILKDAHFYDSYPAKITEWVPKS